jgi:hypothetical protein
VTSLDKLATVCTLYYEVYRWVPLGNWNWQFTFPVINEQFYPDLIIGLLLLWFAWSFATRRRVGMCAASILLTLWVVIHLFDWWIHTHVACLRTLAATIFTSNARNFFPHLGVTTLLMADTPCWISSFPHLSRCSLGHTQFSTWHQGMRST